MEKNKTRETIKYAKQNQEMKSKCISNKVSRVREHD